MTNLDDDLIAMGREELINEIRKLRQGIRAHRDATGHDLCWHHPQLWALLPEPVAPNIAVPSWPEFLHGCVLYRQSLDARWLREPVAPHDDPA